MFTVLWKKKRHHWVSLSCILYPLSFLKNTNTPACTQDSQPHFYLAYRVRDSTTAIFLHFKGPQRYTVLTPLLSDSPQNNPAKLFMCKLSKKPHRSQLQRVCTESKIVFMCPNKLHKDFSSRERERDVEKQSKRNDSLTGMLTSDFSLCLIQCAISRCMIYFCVKSLTAIICHYDDDDDIDDGASFSRHKDVTIDMVPATVKCVQTEEWPLTS